MAVWLAIDSVCPREVQRVTQLINVNRDLNSVLSTLTEHTGPSSSAFPGISPHS